MKVKLKEQGITVFSSQTAGVRDVKLVRVRRRSASGSTGNARFVERDGNRPLMEFHSRDGRKTYRTRQEVILLWHIKISRTASIWRLWNVHFDNVRRFSDISGAGLAR